MMKFHHIVYPLWLSLIYAPLHCSGSEPLSKFMKLCQRGDYKSIRRILITEDSQPSNEILVESFKIALKAENYQICRILAAKVPRKVILRTVLKSRDYKALDSFLSMSSGIALSSVDEMFLDHCLKYCSGCEGVQDEFKLLLSLPALNTELISSTLIGLIDLEKYNVGMLRVLFQDGRFEALFINPFFFNNTMNILRQLSVQGNYSYDAFLVELMSSSVWPKIFGKWSVEAQTYFITSLCKYGAIHSIRHYLSNVNVHEEQMMACISESVRIPYTFAPFILSMLLDWSYSNLDQVKFLGGLQKLIKDCKKDISKKQMCLENYMVLLCSLPSVMNPRQLAKTHSLEELNQEFNDYLLVTRLKFLQVNGIEYIPMEIFRHISFIYLLISGF